MISSSNEQPMAVAMAFSPTASTPGGSAPDNLILRQLQGLRNEFAAVLENQRRDRELIVRLDRHMEERFARLESQMSDGFKDVRSELRDVKADLILVENGLLTRHNEVLAIIRRLDDVGSDVEPSLPPAR